MPSSASTGSAMHGLLLAKISVADLRIAANIFWLSGSDQPAIDQDRDTVGQREDRLHVMLDQEYCQFLLELAKRGDHTRRFFRPESSHRFVKQQHAWP